MGGGSSRLIDRAARAKRSQVDFHTSTVANRIQCQKAALQNQAHQASYLKAACVLPTGLQCGRNDGSFPISGLPCRRSRACSRSMSRSTQHPSQRRGLNVSWANRVPGLQSGTLAMSSSTIHCGCTSQGVGCIVLYRIQSLKRYNLTVKCRRSHLVLYTGIARRACLVYMQTANKSFPIISPTLKRCIREVGLAQQGDRHGARPDVGTCLPAV